MSRVMKDSGIPWIGQIPEKWTVCRLKDCGYLYGGLTGKSGDDFNVDDNDNYSFFIPFTNIYNNLYINPNDLRKVKVEADEKQNLVQSGDLLFLMSSEDYDGIGKPSLLKDNIGTLYLNSFCKGFRVSNKKVNPIYLNFLFTSEIIRELVRIEAKGFIRINLRQDRLSCVPVMLPPLAEQEAIAEFLDRKCGEVDEMVALQEQVIEELKAYKQSIITEAVTKGLNPSAPLKPSHIDWIGEIPEHWEICRIKNKVDFNPGNTTPSNNIEVSFMPMECLRFDDIENKTAMYEDVKEYTPFAEGDIVMAKVTPCFENGNIAVATNLKNGIGFGTSEIFVLRCSPSCYTRYVFYYLRTPYILSRGVSSMTGTGGLKRVNPQYFLNSALILPPADEQREIADYLDQKCADIDALINIKQQKIEDLKEYKKSLIYEYVTGKKRIRL